MIRTCFVNLTKSREPDKLSQRTLRLATCDAKSHLNLMIIYDNTTVSEMTLSPELAKELLSVLQKLYPENDVVSIEYSKTFE